MRFLRSSLVIGLIAVFCTSAWAAKKLQPATKSGRSVTQSETAETTPSKRSVSPLTSAATKPGAVTIDPVVPEIETNQAASSAATYDIPWQSVNGGGAPSSSTNYQVNASVGQSSIGFATSTNYQAGIGYWYGANAVGGGCSCPFQCDYDADGFLTALDLGALIDVLFGGAPEVTDPGCPTSRGDFDCDSFPTALDLGGLIDHLFAGGAAPCDPCNP